MPRPSRPVGPRRRCRTSRRRRSASPGTRLVGAWRSVGGPPPGCRPAAVEAGDARAVTRLGDHRGMPPTTMTRARPATRRPARGLRRPLEQVPMWHGAPPAAAKTTPAPLSPAGGLDGLLDGLNAEQRRAVVHGTGPLLVVAGAGTGKTQVITRRIAWLIATRRARPSEILALTFTDKAADEMQTRVDQLVPYGYTDAAVSTFHAFGDRLVREFALELGLPTDLRVLSRPEVVIFMRERLFEFELDEYRPLGDPTRFLGALATLFSRCKDEDVGPEAYTAFAADLTAAAASAPAGDDTAALVEAARRQTELARAFERYQTPLGKAC